MNANEELPYKFARGFIVEKWLGYGDNRKK